MTKLNMKAIEAWDKASLKGSYTGYYKAFDDYYDACFRKEEDLKRRNIVSKRKAETLAAEAIAQAMLSPGYQVVISNPGSTANAGHLAINGVPVSPTAGTVYGSGSTVTKHNYNTAWTNILLSNGQWGNATWEELESAPAPQMIGIADDGRIDLPKGRQVRMPLGDGSVLYVDKDGNFSVNDKDAKVIYKANRVREFNPYINASDLLIKFMDYVRGLGLDIKKDEVMSLDIGLFVNWLIIEAAERDSDPVPQDVVVTQQKRLKGRVSPRCILSTCRRFIPRVYAAAQFPFCNPLHAEAHIKRLAA